MPKCPECKKDIDFLKHFSKELVEYDFAFNSPEDAQPDYTCIRRYPDVAIEGTWECPECGKVLFIDEEEATEFLRLFWVNWMVKISKWNYGDYSSGNYGAHAMAISIGRLTLYFSYDTVVAFKDGLNFHICKNAWGRTTGKHLNWLDPDKSKRINGEEFDRLLDETLKRYNLII